MSRRTEPAGGGVRRPGRLLEGARTVRPRIGILCNLGEHDGGAHSPRDLSVHAYARAIVAAGGAPLLLPCLSADEATHGVLAVVQGLIVSGGADVAPAHYGQDPRPQLGSISPERDALDRCVVAYLLEHPALPVLGICRGIQALNVFAGGSLFQDVPSQVAGIKHSQQAPGWYATHELVLEADSVLAATVGPAPLWTNSYHHQAVCEVAPGFRAVAHSADGVIEAIEREQAGFCLGVQFHPELMAGSDERMGRLFARLVAEARHVA